MKVALVYDHVNKVGGAERVLSQLHELYPNAPLYTPVYNLKKAPWAKVFKLKSSYLQKLPFANQFHEFYPGFPILAIEQFDFSDFDVVISVTSAEVKGIITSPATLHICYCLTPTRYLWSHYQEYFSNFWFRYISLPVINYLRQWDYIAAQRPDVYVAISKVVSKRIKKYYKRESHLIYPPVDTDFFKPHKKSTNDYYLIVSRLVKYKHIEIAIAACNALQVPLIIVGLGFEKRNLMKKAGPTIEFVNQVSDEQLRLYYQNCQALLFMAEEDFGISAVEALACGKPVIAYKRGGMTEIVQPGICGEFILSQTEASLISAISVFAKKGYNSSLCRKRALVFSKTKFKQEFTYFVEKEWSNFKKNI